MSEHISGSEAAFVEQMNARAAELGMNNTHFVNCNGLDVEGHVTTALDVALMSRELITKYPQIYDYSTIWMEDIVHETAKGNETFTLSSTNKLLKQYPYATGLKTGSTDTIKAMLKGASPFCFAMRSKNRIGQSLVLAECYHSYLLPSLS